MTRNTSRLGSSTIPDGTWDYKEHLKTEIWQVPQLFINTFPHPGKLPQQRLLPLSLALSMTLNPLYMDSTIQTCSWTALYIPMVHKTFNLVLYRCFLVPASLTLSWTPTTMYICIHTCTHTHAHPCKYSYKARPFSLCSQGLAQASSLTPDLDACIPLLCFALGGIKLTFVLRPMPSSPSFSTTPVNVISLCRPSATPSYTDPEHIHPPPFYLRTFALTGLCLENGSPLLCGLSAQMPTALVEAPAYLISPSTLCDCCPSANFPSLLIDLFIVSSSNLRILRSGPRCAIPVESLIVLQYLTHSRCS